MNTITTDLFFYGTLIAGHDNRACVAAHRHLGPGVAGQVTGALYAIPDPGGWYPALVDGGRNVHGTVYNVHGMVYTAPAGFDFAPLDAYEGEEYVRAPVAVMAGGGAVMAQAYLWRGALPPDAKAIEDGDFRAWLARSGGRAFTG
jgi:gamma-glutamylcyclotransferase (GGCT)/AIG2-like uncharacterized protein YtfP